MSRVHAIIYVPGLGDSRVKGQQLAVNAWKFQGVEPYLFRMNWADGEAFEAKAQRLLALIDRLAGEGKTVSLIGTSAGGSAVMNIFSLRRTVINGVVCICGKISNKHTVHPITYQRNAAFQQSMNELDKSISTLTTSDLLRVLSLHPLIDATVPVKDTKLAGVQTGTMLAVGHFFGIVYGLTFGSFRAIRFLKQIDASHYEAA